MTQSYWTRVVRRVQFIFVSRVVAMVVMMAKIVLMVVVMLVVIVDIAVLDQYFAIVQIFSIFSVLSVGGQTRGGQGGRIFDLLRRIFRQSRLECSPW